MSHTYMRASEVLALRNDIALPGNIRIKHLGMRTAGVYIQNSKTGPHQFTPVHDTRCIALIQSYLEKKVLETSQDMFDVQYQTCNLLFKKPAAWFGPDPACLTTHSARIGGAFSDYVSGISAETIAVTGRWKSLKSLQRYLTNGRSGLMQMRTSTFSDRLISTYSKTFQSFIDQCVQHGSQP
ncbi:DNA breaking-rejoining enzyme [Gracilaria domingensis]|nr:DNA breaking-rejoining enzyme [Gracilaria domingensis]